MRFEETIDMEAGDGIDIGWGRAGYFVERRIGNPV